MASTSNVENLSPQILRGVLKEVTELVKGPPEGIKVHMNDEDITDIQATIAGPAGTPYAGGLFRVKLALGKDFPSAPPKGYFLTKIFHPNVASNGEICVNTLKKDWKADLGIRHVLLVIKCLLIVPNAESALNEEAGKLLLEAYDDYAARAKMITEIHAQGELQVIPVRKEVIDTTCIVLQVGCTCLLKKKG
ncbi:ubiquitin-conjugating enzyme E2 S-like isoform X3 [Eriocheir sinensis]|uniref:ubiquitin-conjugating enzyme E2 S-like isoform X3 n=1 Tax=Eriocheir sinensis TaxID=95602 RepID=UPI0021C9D365|nr:ubiquitin-conjugating enzyme E2 S-like isoform X3 [Eriocheir sinensis]